MRGTTRTESIARSRVLRDDDSVRWPLRGGCEVGVDSHLTHEGAGALVEQPDLLHVGHDRLMHLATEQFSEKGVLAAERDLLARVADLVDLGGAHSDRLVRFYRELAFHDQEQ